MIIWFIYLYNDISNLDDCTNPLNTDTSIEGRCGPKFGNVRCNKNLISYALYCNEHNGWCGNTEAHKNAQASDIYDFKPESCNWKCRRSGSGWTSTIRNSGSCIPWFGYVRCNLALAPYVMYCNEANGWCKNTEAHKNAQASVTFDYDPSQCITFKV